MLDIGIPPAWQVLGFGLVFALGAAGREALRVKAARLEARQVDSGITWTGSPCT